MRTTHIKPIDPLLISKASIDFPPQSLLKVESQLRPLLRRVDGPLQLLIQALVVPIPGLLVKLESIREGLRCRTSMKERLLENEGVLESETCAGAEGSAEGYEGAKSQPGSLEQMR